MNKNEKNTCQFYVTIKEIILKTSKLEKKTSADTGIQLEKKLSKNCWNFDLEVNEFDTKELKK
jgi:hypothetical protein